MTPWRVGQPSAISAPTASRNTWEPRPVALGALRDNGSRLGRRLSARIWSEFDFMARQTVDGQALELGWQREGRTDLSADDYLDLIMKKTCWYTTVLPLRVGALIGTKGTVPLEPMLRFGFFLGAAFQIRDDILNLTGSLAVYGKEPLGDLRADRLTRLGRLHRPTHCRTGARRVIQHVLDVVDRIRPHVPAVLEIVGTLAAYAFYVLFAVASVVLAAAYVLELLHRLLDRITGGER